MRYIDVYIYIGPVSTSNMKHFRESANWQIKSQSWTGLFACFALSVCQMCGSKCKNLVVCVPYVGKTRFRDLHSVQLPPTRKQFSKTQGLLHTSVHFFQCYYKNSSWGGRWAKRPWSQVLVPKRAGGEPAVAAISARKLWLSGSSLNISLVGSSCFLLFLLCVHSCTRARGGRLSKNALLTLTPEIFVA